MMPESDGDWPLRSAAAADRTPPETREVLLRADIQRFRYLGAAVPALADIRFAVRKGDFVIVTGPAGAGKTTLCHCLAGVIPKSVQGEFAGRVEIGGQDLAGLALPQLGPLVGMVMQVPENQLFNIVVAEDVAFGPENLQLPPAEVRARVGRSLAFTGASELAQRFTHLLSGGQTQRVVLAAVIALEAAAYIFDQPAAELDPAGRRMLYENIYRLNREAGKTIIVVEDRLNDVIAYANRIVLLDNGRVVRDGPPREFFADQVAANYGVRVPDAVELYHRLRDKGISLGQVTLTVHEVVEQLRARLPDGATAVAVRAEGAQAQPAAAAANATPVVEISGLAYRYPAGVEALRGVDLSFYEREFAAIVGENGAGKTTLAKHLIGLLKPTAGTVRVLDQPTARLPVHRISQWVGFLFQDPDYQTFNNSCLEEVAHGLKLRRLPAAAVREQALAALDEVGLADVWNAHPYTLSRGQRQRLAFASILALRPPILIVDEPSTGLDYRETLAVMKRLQEYRQQGGTIVIITHDIDMAIRFADRLVVMTQGRVIHDSPAGKIHEHLDTLSGSAVLLPDLAEIVRRLGLPDHIRTVPDVVAAVVGAAHGKGGE